MIDFTMLQTEFSKVCKLMSSARTNADGDLVDITANAREVTFAVTGRNHTLAAAVDSQGAAQIPVNLFAKLGKVASTYKDAEVRVRIEPTRVRINTMAIAFDAPKKPVGGRMIDIPDDALPVDVLALPLMFTSDEIHESNLTERVMAANSLRLKELQAAGDRLMPLGIDAHMLDELHKEVIRQHAEKLRPILLPGLMSDLE